MNYKESKRRMSTGTDSYQDQVARRAEALMSEQGYH
jgi:hypothetical protein